MNFIKALLIFFLTLSVSCISIKPIYNSDEQAKAERAVAQIHKLYNEQNTDELFNIMDEEARQNVSKENISDGVQQTFNRWGKIQNAKLSQVKVFPYTPIQVRMIYNIKYEKGDGQEWYIFAIRGNEARLLQVQNFPGTDKGETKQ